MGTLVRDVCRLYPACFVGHETVEDGPIPMGWRKLLLAALGDLVEVLGPTPGQRVLVTRVSFHGVLHVDYQLHPLDGKGAALGIVVAVIIAAAGRRSLRICDRCAFPGVPRSGPGGVRSVRCDLHAEVGHLIGTPRPGSEPDGAAVADRIEPPTVVEGAVGRVCAAVSNEIIDATSADEVPPGWRRLCCDLDLDLAAMMTGAAGHRLEIRRRYAHQDALRWEVALAPSVPEVIRRGVDVAFRRAAEDAGLTCGSCSRRPNPHVDAVDACACGAPLPPLATMSRPVPAVTLPLLPPYLRTGPMLQDRSPRPWPRVRSVAVDAAAGPRIPVYARANVAAALGLSTSGHEGPDLVVHGTGGDSELHTRLQALLDRGDEGRWRTMATPEPSAIAAIAALMKIAPHLVDAIDHVVRHLRAAATMGLPVSLPPTVLLGPPGVGKSWFVTRLSRLLGLPHRLLAMNLVSTGDSISGAHGTWRNAGPGLVAKLLLAQGFANPLIAVDEFDKARSHGNDDPYASFYTLFEPIGARTFTDEYYDVDFDASNVLWIMSANDLRTIPEPILSRLTVIDVPEPGPEHLAAVVDSTYSDANAARNLFFAPHLDPEVRARLAGHPPRSIRVMLEDAMVRAAAVGRRTIINRDLVERRTGLRSQPMGFIHSSRMSKSGQSQ